MERLNGKVAVVTGGGSGIGRAIAERFAKEGAHVVIAGRKEQPLQETAAADGKISYVVGDITKTETIEEIVRTVQDKFGRLDILVNNAGITRDGLMLTMKEADWDAVLDTNLKGAFHCMKAAYRPMMKQKYGRIVNLSSIVGLRGNAGQANYAASKAGLIGLTKSLAKELAARNVTVNAVAPGFIDTDMTAALPEKAREAMLSTIPMGRLGQAEDVARAVAFFAGEGAGYVTGQVLCVDGGMAV